MEVVGAGAVALPQRVVTETGQHDRVVRAQAEPESGASSSFGELDRGVDVAFALGDHRQVAAHGRDGPLDAGLVVEVECLAQ